MTNQVKYDRNKDRQGLFKEDFLKPVILKIYNCCKSG